MQPISTHIPFILIPFYYSGSRNNPMDEEASSVRAVILSFREYIMRITNASQTFAVPSLLKLWK
jgi:hypothetical protein